MKSIKKGSENYCATIVQVNETYPIEGADKIVRTLINGTDIIVSKDVKIGDIMIYFNSGTKLNPEFCKYNNLLTDAELNKDKVSGYISYKQFRVKAIKLKGVISDGILLPLSSLNFDSSIVDSLSVGDTFTDINNVSICEKYIVPVRNSNPGGSKPKQAKKFNRIIDNQFHFHNDTDNLRKNMHKINPEDIISIHYKKHGTSVVIAHIPVKRKLSLFERVLQWFGVMVQTYIYDVVYSSRRVIKNQYSNDNNSNNFYKEDIWGIVSKQVGDKIPKNWTLYGEIIGYLPSGGYIQHQYDYGCTNNLKFRDGSVTEYPQHKFYVYKISIVNIDGTVTYLTDKQIEEYCEKVGLLYKDTFIYYGTAVNFMEEIYKSNSKFDRSEKEDELRLEDWRNQLLNCLEKEFNEKDCYMCNNKVPEEGIVLRVEKLYEYEAYKLKSKRFILQESNEQEQEISNIEDN